MANCWNFINWFYSPKIRTCAWNCQVTSSSNRFLLSLENQKLRRYVEFWLLVTGYDDHRHDQYCRNFANSWRCSCWSAIWSGGPWSLIRFLNDFSLRSFTSPSEESLNCLHVGLIHDFYHIKRPFFLEYTVLFICNG